MFFKNNNMIKDAVKEGEKPQGRKMNWEQGKEYSQKKQLSITKWVYFRFI